MNGKNIMGGRMKSFSINGSEGILFTTSDSFRIKGTPNDKSQRLIQYMVKLYL